MKNDKVYAVMGRYVFEGSIDEIGVERIFSSEKKAIEYINERFKNNIITFNEETEEYAHYLSEYERIVMFVEEFKVY